MPFVAQIYDICLKIKNFQTNVNAIKVTLKASSFIVLMQKNNQIDLYFKQTFL